MLAIRHQSYISKSLFNCKATLSSAASLCHYHSPLQSATPCDELKPFTAALPYVQQRNHTLAARTRAKLYYQFPFLRGFKPESKKKRIAILGTGKYNFIICYLCVLCADTYRSLSTCYALVSLHFFSNYDVIT